MYISVFFGLIQTRKNENIVRKNIVKMGCIVSYSCCALNEIDMVSNPQVPSFLYVTGYLLVYGTILAKMRRVYHIFYSTDPSKSVNIYNTMYIHYLAQ